MIENAAREAPPELILNALARKFPGCLLEFRAELFIRLFPSGEADHRKGRWQIAICRQIIESGDQLAMRQVASGAKDYDRARLRHRPAR